MSEKIMVFAWVKKGSTDYGYNKIWGGDSIIKALHQAWVAKAHSGCVKIEWRGTRRGTR